MVLEEIVEYFYCSSMSGLLQLVMPTMVNSVRAQTFCVRFLILPPCTRSLTSLEAVVGSDFVILIIDVSAVKGFEVLQK